MALVAFYFNLGLRENENFQVSVRSYKLLDKILLCVEVLAEDDLVADRVWNLSCIFSNQVEHNRILHVLACDLLNILWHCR